MSHTVRHVVITRRYLSTLAVDPRSEASLVEAAADGEWDPAKRTLSFDMDFNDLRALAARLAGSRYVTARSDAVPQRWDIAPRDICVYFLNEVGDVLCAATAEDDPPTVSREIRRVTERIEALNQVRTSLIQRGHDLDTSDRRLAGASKLSHPHIATLHRGERPAHRLEGDAMQVLRTAGIPTEESVRVYSNTNVDEIDDAFTSRTWVPSVRVGVHSCGEVRLAAGRYETIDQARDCVDLTKRAAELLQKAPKLAVRLEHTSKHVRGNESVDLPVYVISWDAPSVDGAPGRVDVDSDDDRDPA
jgi:hypothetical protein